MLTLDFRQTDKQIARHPNRGTNKLYIGGEMISAALNHGGGQGRGEQSHPAVKMSGPLIAKVVAMIRAALGR